MTGTVRSKIDKVTAQAVVVDIVQLQLKAIGERQVAAAADLHGPGQAGLDGQPAAMIVAVKLHDALFFRPRPDQAHLPPQHIVKLRQFVEACAAQNAPDTRYARIVCNLKGRLLCQLAQVNQGVKPLLGAVDHAAQLENAETAAILADAHLAEEDRSRASLA